MADDSSTAFLARAMAVRMLFDKQVRRIPVVNENKYLVGMISMADVAVETREGIEQPAVVGDVDERTLTGVRRYYRAAVRYDSVTGSDPHLMPCVHLPRGVLASTCT